MIGRGATEHDKDILLELQTKYSDSVKIDLDILSEPCIFFKYKGPWEMVYKLSATGQYIRPMVFYCTQVDNAIKEFIVNRDSLIQQQKLDEIKVLENNKKFEKQREHFSNKGFVNNLPD